MSDNKDKKQDKKTIKEEKQDWAGRRAKKLGVKRKLIIAIAGRI